MGVASEEDLCDRLPFNYYSSIPVGNPHVVAGFGCLVWVHLGRSISEYVTHVTNIDEALEELLGGIYIVERESLGRGALQRRFLFTGLKH